MTIVLNLETILWIVFGVCAGAIIASLLELVPDWFWRVVGYSTLAGAFGVIIALQKDGSGQVVFWVWVLYTAALVYFEFRHREEAR